MRRASVTAVAVLFLLVLANFGFDCWRRIDFESARREAGDVIKSAQHRVSELNGIAEGALREVSVNLETCGELLTRTSALNKELLDACRRSPDAVAKDPAGDPPSEVQTTETQTLLNILNASTEDMLATIKSNRRDHWFLEQAEYLRDTRPSLWDAEKLIAGFQERFQASSLSPEDRELIRNKLDIFSALTECAQARYNLGLQLSINERIASGRFEEVDPSTGQTVRDQSIAAGDVFALSSVGMRTFRWSKSEFAEEYRLATTVEFVPSVLLNQLEALFKERSR